MNNDKNIGFNPKDVVSPQKDWSLIDVIYENRLWSMAIGRWRTDDNPNNPVLVMRWNGEKEGHKGNPISRGFPTWFVLPDETYKMFVSSGIIPEDKLPFVKEILKDKI